MNHAAINALVAERVMGWRWCEKFMHWYPPGPDVTLNDTRTKRDFDPSRNIAHAHQMRDKFLRENQRWYLSTNHQLNAHGQMVHFATVCKPELVSGFFAESGLEEPTVLCLAVLRAIGVPDKEIEEVANG